MFSEGEVLAKIGDIELVNWRSNTLSKRSKQLTTVSALYTIAETLEKDRGWSAKVLPTDEESIEEAFENNTYFCEQLLKGLSIYREYLTLTREDKTVSKLRKQSLLMKPVAHMALAHVAYMAQKKDLDWAEIVLKLDKVDWSMDNPLWFNILVIGSANKKMITGKESIKATGLVISYMVMGDYMTTEEIEEVHRVISNSTNGEKNELPQKIQ